MRVNNPGGITFTPFNGKIADINEADVNEHSTTLAALGLPANTVVLIYNPIRIAGVGQFEVKSISGGRTTFAWIERTGLWVVAADGNLYYEQSVANDDFDIYCFGYWAS